MSKVSLFLFTYIFSNLSFISFLVTPTYIASFVLFHLQGVCSIPCLEYRPCSHWACKKSLSRHCIESPWTRWSPCGHPVVQNPKRCRWHLRHVASILNENMKVRTYIYIYFFFMPAKLQELKHNKVLDIQTIHNVYKYEMHTNINLHPSNTIGHTNHIWKHEKCKLWIWWRLTVYVYSKPP